GGLGVVFKLSTNGNFTKLKTFTTVNDGAFPSSGLVQGTNDGNFYGTTFLGSGPLYRGNVFKITPGGTETSLVEFDGTNGFYPTGWLVQGNDGNFYGTTGGGADGCGIFAGGCTGSLTNGSVFKVTPGGTLTTLVAFNEANGKNPAAGLTLHPNGNFYGTTLNGGINGFGTVFQMTPGGTLTSLYSFSGSDGAFPYAGLTVGTNGNLYGSTTNGGDNSLGTIFQITPTGTLTTLISFNGSNGSIPKAAPKQGTDGNFYGTTSTGGANGLGTVYVLTPNGALTRLYSFKGENFGDGKSPEADLLQASDGNFYGTTRAGGNFQGSGENGIIFKLDPRPFLASAVNGSDFILVWSDYAVGYTLESTTSLTPPIVWNTVTNEPSTEFSGFLVVSNTISAGSKFYRLKK
ncbi:MAG: choice-of-anchor tandem repeat GloVer-containing protein, partial [Verrucomicrobiota bacterium]